MEILIKDGSKLQVADNASVLEIAKQIFEVIYGQKENCTDNREFCTSTTC